MRLRLIAAATVPALALTLAGCGESALHKYAKAAPTSIDKDARSALAKLSSVHLGGTMNDNGTTLALDMSLDNKGNCTGSITSGGQKVELVGVAGGSVYVKAGASFWQRAGGMPAATAAAFATKWVTGKSLGSFGGICDLSQFAKSINDTTVAEDKAKVIGTGKINGYDVVNLQVTDKDNTTSTLSVEADAPHNVIRVTGPKNSGTVTFTQFNAPVKTSAPAGAINLDQQLGSN